MSAESLMIRIDGLIKAHIARENVPWRDQIPGRNAAIETARELLKQEIAKSLDVGGAS